MTTKEKLEGILMAYNMGNADRQNAVGDILHLFNNERNEANLRPAVLWFAEQMELKLRKNDHKGGWKNCELQYLSVRLTQERKEISKAIRSKNATEIIKECADLANFALMIADLHGKRFGQ